MEPTIVSQEKEIYSDTILSVWKGLNLRTQGLDISPEHQFRDLSNGIKITAKNLSEPKFLQFVTRICSDLYKPNMVDDKPVSWDGEIDLFYMADPFTPRWKIDVTLENETCFYEENGCIKRKDN